MAWPAAENVPGPGARNARTGRLLLVIAAILAGGTILYVSLLGGP